MLCLIRKFFPNIYSFYLVLLLLFHLIFNFLWQKINIAPPTWDSAGHLVLSFIFSDKLVLLSKGLATISTVFHISTYYPPLVHLLGGVSVLIFGRSYEIPLFLISTGFYLSSIYVLYLILLCKFPGKFKLAFFTSLVFSFFPQVWEQSRSFHLDIPLVFFLLLSYLFLIKSNFFKSWEYSLLFFLSFSLVQLTKWYGFIYLIVPVFLEYSVSSTLHSVFNFKSGILPKILLGIFLVLMVAAPWYILNTSSILAMTSVASTPDAGDPTNLFSLANIFHYSKMTMSHQIGFLSFILGLISFPYLFVQNRKLSLSILLSILVPYFIFSFIRNKDLRYILPLTPYFALVISLLFDQLKLKMSYLYVSYLLFLYLFFSFNQFKVLSGVFTFPSFLMSGPYYSFWKNFPTYYSYSSQDWKGERILKDISQQASLEPSLIGDYKILELSDNRYYSIASFDMYKMQNKFYDMVLKVPYNVSGTLEEADLNEYLGDVAFAIVPLNPGPDGLRNISVLRQLKDYFSRSNGVFDMVGEYSLPDGNVLSLYRRANMASISTYTVRPDSLQVQVSRLLHLDSTSLPGTSYVVHFFDSSGRDTVRRFGDTGLTQETLSLEGITSFRIDLPRDQLKITDLRGWAFRDMNFVRLPDYKEDAYIFSNGRLQPYSASSRVPDNNLILDKDSFVLHIGNSSVPPFVALARAGWVWETKTTFTPTLEVPLEGLLRLEITIPDLIISVQDLGWDFFPCYEGRAVCFYPAEKSL